MSSILHCFTLPGAISENLKFQTPGALDDYRLYGAERKNWWPRCWKCVWIIVITTAALCTQS